MIWIPIFQKDNSGGQIELVKDSHKWGHVPHRNRRPIEMPNSYKTIKTNIKLGDVLIFSTTIMHRSLPTKFSSFINFKILFVDFLTRSSKSSAAINSGFFPSHLLNFD